MSVENLKEYARRCATEPELRAVARELGASDLEGHVRHAASLGLDWTMDDMVAFRKEMLDAEDGSGSLTEEELEQTVGGTSTISAAAVVAGSAAVATTGGVVATVGDAWS